jgi:hypothetical protein
MRPAGKRVGLLLSAVCAFGAFLCAQEPCKPPPLNLASSGPNIFSEQQEQELGDALAQEFKSFRVTEDPAVTAHMARIGDRLAQHLPPNQIHFRYFLVDSGVTNAFSVSGGRIYVFRGMVAQLRGPDEMAAILAHEMGHIVTHQSAINFTFLLQQVLGVTQVTDRQDIQKKLDDLRTYWRNKPAAFRQIAHRGEENQLQADQVGLYAMTAAGFSPEVFPELFDRTTNTRGRTGGWLSDLLQTTTPEQLRLRQALATVEAMPPACIAQRLSADSGDFQKWRAEVFDFTGWSKRIANLHGVLAQVKLDPIPVGDIQYIRFSPDGRFLLAEKDQSLYIFTRDPLAFLFRIHAPDATQVRFTIDSKSVAFVTTGSRVEVWDLASRTRVRADDPQLDSPCAYALLSPDARTLACLRGDGDLNLIELSSGSLRLEKKQFIKVVDPKFIYASMHRHMDFSPDGHYFLACGRSGVVGFDLTSQREIRLRAAFDDILPSRFLFLSDNSLLELPSNPLMIALRQGHGSLSAVLHEFPSSRTIDKIPAGSMTTFIAPTRGDYLLVGPVPKHEMGIMDLSSKKILWVIDEHALDVYDQVYARQLLGGDLGLFDMHSGDLQARVALPPPENANPYLRATASPGLKWLAAPAGAVWDLSNGKMIFHVRSFHGGGFAGEESFYADFPAFRDMPRTQARLNLLAKDLTPGPKIEDRFATQYGSYLVVTKPRGPDGAGLHLCHWNYSDLDVRDCDATREVRDVRTGQVLWDRRFPKEDPEFNIEPEQGRVILRWAASDSAVQDEIKNYSQFADAWTAARKQPGGAFIEILNLSDGAVLHATVLENGWGARILTAGERLIVGHPGYMEIFSLAGGGKEGEIPGSPGAVSQTGKLFSVRGDATNELEIYDLRSREKLDYFAFPVDVDYDQFSDDAQRLLVLTRDQTAYILTAPAARASGSTVQ